MIVVMVRIAIMCVAVVNPILVILYRMEAGFRIVLCAHRGLAKKWVKKDRWVQ